MTRFISHIHAETRRARLTRRGATTFDDSTPCGTHKTYQRMKQIPLPEPQPLDVRLDETLKHRASYFKGHMEGTPSLNMWGTDAGLSLGAHPDSYRRFYPSGGALYPVETYLFGSVIEGSPSAIYHYAPHTHALEELWKLPEDFYLKSLQRAPEDLYFSVLMVFTSVWNRSSAKYGDLAYSHGMLEAGHMSENILLVATALGLLSRPLGGFNDELICDLLDLPREEEQPVHSIGLSLPNL